MDQPQSTSSSTSVRTWATGSSAKILMSSILLVLGVGIGFAGGWYFASVGTVATDQTSTPDQTADDAAYQAGFDAARERLVDQGIIAENEEPVETDTVFGRVAEVGGAEIVVEVSPADPLSDVERYVVAINDETALRTAVPLTLAEFDAALIEYEMAVEEMEPGAEEPPMPEPFEFSSLHRDDIQVGDEVMVQTAQAFERGGLQRLVAAVFQKQQVLESEEDTLPVDE